LRSKIGVMFGNPETTTGGNALKFYASVRMDIRRISAIKSGDSVVGSHTRVKIVKSKVAPPFKEVEFDIIFNEGISKPSELIDLGVEFDVLKKSGAWLTFGEDRFNGKEQFKTKLLEDSVMMKKLENAVKAALGMEIKDEQPEEKEVADTKKKK